MFDLEDELKKLPTKPGVYLMRNKTDEIIYVGKAINLKNRVRQYFQASRTVTSKIEKMISQIDHFEYIITDSELEALVLECNLIKEYSPKYNTMLKDDKSYPYIMATIGEDYPRLLLARKIKSSKQKIKYFGPYTSGLAIKDTLELIRKIYYIRTCNRNLPKDIGKERPCLSFHIKQCKAPCQGFISKEEYKKLFDKALDFLNGDYREVLKMLEEKMKKASENFLFEEAAQYRDLLNSVHQIAQRQKITSFEQEDRDIVAMARAKDEAVVQVFFIRSGKLIGRDHFHLTGVEQEERKQVIASFIKQFYAGTPYIPRELILQEIIEDQKIIEDWLTKKRGQRVYIKVPKRGEKEKLVELAEKNASLILQQDTEKIKREESRTIGAMKKLQKLLDIERLERIESFDISNINGFQSVGSMVVFEKGKPKKNDYRKFRMKWVKGIDDYASMEEIISRRFLHGLEERKELKQKEIEQEFGKFTKFPDLIMMDGGKGQVNIAQKVLEKFQLDIPVCGLVKDDNHRTRGIYFKNKEISFETGQEEFHLITRIQDETHRFAIEYHRSLRKKEQVHSILDEISGIGSTRRKALMKYFESIEELKKASVEELCKIPSMNQMSATKVYEFFH